MEKTNLSGQDDFQDENTTPIMSNNDAQGLKQDDQLSIYASEFKKESKSINSKNPLMFITNQPNDSSQCNLKLRQSRGYLTIQDYISFLNLDQNLGEDSANLFQYVATDLYCRTMPPFKISMGIHPTDSFTENFKHHRRSRSTVSLDDFFCTSERWIIATRELMKSTLPFQLATIDSTMSRIAARDFITRQRNSLNSVDSPSHASPPEHQLVVDSNVDQKHSLKLSGKMPVSYSSMNLQGSYLSTSSAHSSISKGLLHCIWKRGALHFAFMVTDDCSEIYVADPCKIGSSINMHVGYMYMFHSRRSNTKEFSNFSKCNTASKFVGKMKVSSSIILDPNQSNAMETEFVLFGSDGDHTKKMETLASNPMKNKGLSKKVAKIFRPRYSFKHNSNCVTGEPSFQDYTFLQSSCLDELNSSESNEDSDLGNDFPPNLELCAIVIKDYKHESRVVGGWGLKFLERIADDECHRGSSAKPAINTSVLVPAGFHGGPTTLTGGASSLIERWRSGGHCDCGGWDTGCPLMVIDGVVTEDFLKETEEENSTINLFINGAKQEEPTLAMVKMKRGEYNVYFQSTLSALQSFAIGVAVIHSQTEALCPKS